MKCLLLKCDRFAYVLDHPTPEAEDLTAGAGAEFVNVLVIFVAVEPGDASKVSAAAKEIRRRTRQAAPEAVVVNPFMHLTATPADPETARDVCRALVDRLAETMPIDVTYTSFGWYKRFDLEVDGDVHSQRFIAV